VRQDTLRTLDAHYGSANAISPRATRYLHSRLTRGLQIFDADGNVAEHLFPCAVRDCCIQLSFVSKHEDLEITQVEAEFGSKGDKKFRQQAPRKECLSCSVEECPRWPIAQKMKGKLC
jgi:hypothetical protein